MNLLQEIADLPPKKTDRYIDSLSDEAILRLDDDLLQEQKQECEASLSAFIEHAWHVLEPSTPYISNWHIDAVVEHLEAVTLGEIRNLLINMPPRCTKSLTVAVFWPTWEWTSAPEIRWLFSSYVEKLATRDCVKSRRLIQSSWYKKLWGDLFALTSDQNEKTRYENDKTGYRIATSVEGAGTGEGGDRIVCLTGETLIETDQGPIPIGDLVRDRRSIKVLGPCGWQTITAHEESTGRPLIELEFDNGQLLRCTEDHPIWLEGYGFRPAKDVYYLHGNLQVRCMRKRFPACPSTCKAGKARALLFAYMLWCLRAWWWQSRLEGRKAIDPLQLLRQTLSYKALGSKTASILFSCLPLRCVARGSQTRVSDVRRYVSPQFVSAEILLTLLCKRGTSTADSRGQQRALSNWQVVSEVYAGIYEEAPQGHRRTRCECVRDLWGQRHFAGSSYRWVTDESQADESSNALYILPSDNPHEDRHFNTLDEPVGIKAVRRRPPPDAVFNLRVEPDRCYYANGILTHNCDDPHNVKEGESEAKREATVDWWDEVMSTRGNDPETSSRVIVMQRIHDNDLSGHVLKQGGYEYLCLPAEYEKKVYVTSLGFRDPRTKDGELLCPARFPRAVIEEMKLRLGPYGTAGQFQQRPAPRGGGMFKRAWFTIVDNSPGRAKRCRYWDKAGTEGGGKYTAGARLSRSDGVTYIEDMVRGQWSAATRERTIKQTAELDADIYTSHGVAIWVEQEPGSGGKESAESTIKNLAGYPTRPDRPTGDKFTRADPLAAAAEAGNVKLIRGPWNEAFLQEMEMAGKGAAYLDQMDAAAGAFNKLTSKTVDISVGPIGAEQASAWRIE